MYYTPYSPLRTGRRVHLHLLPACSRGHQEQLLDVRVLPFLCSRRPRQLSAACSTPPPPPLADGYLWSRFGFQAASLGEILLAPHRGELSSIPGGAALEFSRVGNVTDDAAGRRAFSGSPVSPALAFRRCPIPDTTHQQVAMSGTIPSCGSPGVAPSGIEPGSLRCKANSLTTGLPRMAAFIKQNHSPRVVVADDYLEPDSIACLEWPTSSPDLSPTEHARNTIESHLTLRPIGQDMTAKYPIWQGRFRFRASVKSIRQFRLRFEGCCCCHLRDACYPMRVIEVRMEQCRNENMGETGDPREDPPTSGIVRHDFQMRKSAVTRPRVEPGSP
ncbi:hypothetical protein PR048_007734 [Dryococelus australis]|uniref:Uncharacterized protein n=1 Tax=Dryococelus australis TaxID=614101 RepID=A0ABQ9HVH1_9NEOP|nr:hypothetical protein PR048_007734 [Dryococelus australis]